MQLMNIFKDIKFKPVLKGSEKIKQSPATQLVRLSDKSSSRRLVKNLGQ